jgi:hypothetical protein
VALVVIQVLTVTIYIGATLLPYLVHYALPGRELNLPNVPNVTPSEILPTTAGGVNPVNWLAIAGFWVTMVGPLLAGGLAILGAGVAIARWRPLTPRLRAWLVTGTVLCVALTAFELSPLGFTLADWVLD